MVILVLCPSFSASVVGDGDLSFYKELAERRREALNDSLAENESLVNENSILKYENSELNKTNQSLQESVNKASRLAEMLEVKKFCYDLLFPSCLIFSDSRITDYSKF